MDIRQRRQRSNSSPSIDQSSLDDLVRIDDALLHHVTELALGAIITPLELVFSSELLQKLANDDAALGTGVVDDLAHGALQSLADDGHAQLLVKVLGGVLEGLEGERGLEEGDTTTGQDTFLNGSASGVESVVVAVLLLADFDFRGTTDLDDGDTTGQLGQALLQLGLVVLASGGVGNDAPDLLAARGDGVLGTTAVQEDGVLLGDGNGTALAQQVGGSLFELDVQLVGEDGTTGEDGHVAEDALAVVTEAWGLDAGDLELAAELVEDACCEGLAVDVLSDDEEWATGLGGDFEGRKDILESADLLLREEDEGLLELDALGLNVGDEVRRDETTVEAHALGDLDAVFDGLALLDGDDTFLADLLHGGGDEVADVGVAVGGDGGDLSDFLAGGDHPLLGLEEGDDMLDGLLASPAEVHGVAAGSYVLDTFGEDGAGEDGGGSGTITSNLVSLASYILDETDGAARYVSDASGGAKFGDCTYRAPRFSNLSLS